MIDDVSDIAELYNSSLEQEHTRLERHQLEYDLTWRYLSQYLPPQGKLLEVGAATGRYTLELAKRGMRSLQLTCRRPFLRNVGKALSPKD